MASAVTLKRILAARFFVLASVFSLSMMLVMLFWLKPRLQDLVTRSNESLATALAVQAEKYLAAPQRTLEVLAERIVASEAGQQMPLTPLLDALVESSDFFEVIYVVDRKGRIEHLGLPDTVKNRNDFVDLDLSGNPLVDRTRHGAKVGPSIWSNIFLSAVSGRLAVALALSAGEHTVIGEVGLANLSAFVRRVANQEGTSMIIVDGQGQVLAHPDVEVARQQLNISYLPLLKAGEHSLGTAVTRFEGVEVIATRAPIAGIDWLVLVMQPLSIAREPMITTLVVLSVVGLLATLLAIGLGIGFARRLAGVFERLVGTAESVAVGRYPGVWPRSRVVEFGRLIDSLLRMSSAVREREEALASSQNQLRDLNQSLEQRVEERTAQLVSANAELQSTLAQLSVAQDELQRAERLAALGALVAGVAHELNTPIGNCLVVATACAAKQREFEAEIEHGLKRSSLNALVEGNRKAMDLLQVNLRRSAELISSFKQVAVDQTTAQRRRFFLHDTVHEIVVTVSPTVKISGCRVVFDVPEDIRMESFPGPLGQVLSNLINNAVIHAYAGCATPEHGEISIEARLLENDWVVLTVADKGEGIPPEHIKRVFDPFFTTRMGQGGTGLGLHIVYNIVNDLLGGRIRVESEPGRGSRFIIQLPCVAPVSAIVV